MATSSAFTDGLTFYRQTRADGGIRTGILIAGSMVLGRFDEGEGEYDPTLIWSVDLRCAGSGVPRDRQGAREWLLHHEETVTAGFRKFADELNVGIDLDFYPLEWDRFDNLPEGVRLKVVCSIQRRFEATVLATELRELAEHWRPMIESLTSPQALTL